jgi:hypothetical protein
MICYKDMTLCEFCDTCKEGHACHRALTKERQDEADKLRLPICTFIEYPNCYEEITKC